MAAGNLRSCLPVTLKYEGGFSNDPRDNGNWTGGLRNKGVLRGTKYGIAASAHPEVNDIAGLTLIEAEAIYQKSYWTPAGCERLSFGLDLQHFDATVNSGLGHSARWLKAAQSITSPAASIHAYSAARLHSLESFKTWATFGKGWAARVAGVEAAAINMAAGSGHITVATAASTIKATGAKAATKGKVMTAAAHTSTAVVVCAAATAVTTVHPYAAVSVGVIAFASALWTSFRASVAGARAATLAHASVS